MLPPGALSLGACGGAFFPPRRPARRSVRARTSGDATAPPEQPSGESSGKWHDSVLEGAKRLSAEHLPPLREAAQRVVSQAAQAAERVPQTAKAVEFSTGLWARLPEPAQKAAPPVAGALGVLLLGAMIRGAGANNPALFKAMHPSGRLDDVAFLQRELLRVLQEKRALETRCLEAELSLAAALEAAAKGSKKRA